jgi:Family of unknown function (DUF5990)
MAKDSGKEQILQLRVSIIDPPAGVIFAVQRGKSDLLLPDIAKPALLVFRFSLRLIALDDGGFNFLGEYAQGPRGDRFIYVNSGAYAGQPASPWGRRAKLKLDAIPRELLRVAAGKPTTALEARVKGTMKDGGPVCASVPPASIEWGPVKHES